MRILIATGNSHKTQELRAMLGPDHEVVDLTALSRFKPAEETGVTFEENAILKAVHASRHFDGLVLADDSGLEVAVLGGEPGVHSARYAGTKATDADNRAKLRQTLAAHGFTGSAARFQCTIAAARNGEILGTWSGHVAGRILVEERGDGGFGYDSMFVPEGQNGTFAELSADVKNALSHRARALEACRKALAVLLG